MLIRTAAGSCCLLQLLLWFASGVVGRADRAPINTAVNVTVDDVVLHLTQNDKAPLGVHFYLDKRTQILLITCRAETAVAATSGQRQLLLTPAGFDWRKAGSNESVLADKLLSRRASFHTECSPEGFRCASTLRIHSPVNSDAASAYECLVTPSFRVNQTLASVPAATVASQGVFLSRPLITLKVQDDAFDMPVWSTDVVEITCLVEGSPQGDIRWSKERDPGFELIGNQTLRLTGQTYERDRGNITCTSRNSYGANQATVFLRVKNPLAFVAPLVGIGIELLAMLAVVVAYEVVQNRRRKLQAADAAATALETENNGKAD